MPECNRARLPPAGFLSGHAGKFEDETLTKRTMNKLQQFIHSVPLGFLKSEDIAPLIAIDRLCYVLVRCGGCRFTCAAQDVEHLIKCVSAGGDYVRDVSFPVGAMERAASYVPEPFRSEHPCPMPIQPAKFAQAEGAMPFPRRTPSQSHAAFFNENDCGGVFDGHGVTSDADPGL